MANGKEGVPLRKGPSTERKAWKGHDTKRSDWRDPSRLEPVRPHRINHTMTRSQEMNETPHFDLQILSQSRQDGQD